MKKILIVTPGGMPVPSVKGGAVQNLIELLIKENQKDNSNEITIISPYDEEAEEIAKSDYKNSKFKFVKIPYIFEFFDLLVYYFAKYILRKKHLVSYRNNFKYLFFSISTSKILSKNDYDKVIVENNVRNFWAFKMKNNFKKYKRKYYFHLHNIPRSAAGCKQIINSSKKFLCVSDFLAREIQSETNKIGPVDSKKTYTLKNCIDTTKFKEIINDEKLVYYKDKFGIKEDDKIILFVGRLSEEKGVLETIKAIKNMKNKQAKLLVVGSCFYGMKIKSKFEDILLEEASSIKDKIIFTGYVPYDDMPYIYNLADFSILPSLWKEPAGLTIIESMACGTPVITTYAGGIPEYTNEKCSFILKVDDKIVENITEKADLLIENEKLRNEMKKECIIQSKKYSCEIYYRNFINSIDL